MKIAIIGPGGIGSTFAFQLSQTGHDVTVIARTKRLETLTREGAITKTSGERAQVQVCAELDQVETYDLVLVTVLAHQVDAVLPAVQSCAAKSVMFMFNTFESFDRLRDTVGEQRFRFGFPAILASLDEGRLKAKIYNLGQVTMVTDAAWGKVFTEAGITCAVPPDMESWLRTHVALVVPFMTVGVMSCARQGGVSWKEAMNLTHGLTEAFSLVRQLGNTITPVLIAGLARTPRFIVAAILWMLSRFSFIRGTGRAGSGEPLALIDAMAASTSQPLPALAVLKSYL